MISTANKSMRTAALAAAVAMSSFGEVFADDTAKYEARFNENGELIRPSGWREWVFVGSPLTPNSLNAGEAPFPEFHTVYIDPESWNHYKETGEFREGAMFAKELTLVGDTAATSGIGFFNGDLQGFEIAVEYDRDKVALPGEDTGSAARRNCL